MTSFADHLRQLPAIDHLAQLQLLNAMGHVVATIDNQPGQTGSLAIYHALAVQYGRIDATAAQEGLRLFAEHTASARQHPGSHPHIDRLLDILDCGHVYTVRCIQA